MALNTGDLIKEVERLKKRIATAGERKQKIDDEVKGDRARIVQLNRTIVLYDDPGIAEDGGPFLPAGESIRLCVCCPPSSTGDLKFRSTPARGCVRPMFSGSARETSEKKRPSCTRRLQPNGGSCYE